MAEWFRSHKRWKLGSSKQCFVIMPFSKTRSGTEAEWTAFFENFLRPALEQCGYQAKRSVAAQDNIVENIVQDLAWADVVLAVLTDFNANVLYELGVRHSLRLGTVLVCRKNQIKKIPFDLKHHGFADYEPFDVRHPEAAIKSFVAQLRERQLLENARRELPDNPVATFLRSGLIYCVNKALAWRRKVVGMLDDALVAGGEPAALELIDSLNGRFDQQDIEFTIVKDDKILRHNPKVPVGASAEQCWFDMTRVSISRHPNGTTYLDPTSLYPEMKALGFGLRLGSISEYPGRITAIAFERMPSQGWLIVVEAHVNQSHLTT